MNQPTTSTTPFIASVRVLAERGGSVPMGWQLGYNAMLCSLMAIHCQARGQVTFSGPHIEDINLRVSQKGSDPVVAGILGRLARVTAQTCEVCGSPGTLRCMGGTTKVLCSRCAAPRMASHALGQLLTELEAADHGRAGRIIWYDDMPPQVRPMLDADVWLPAKQTGDVSTKYRTSHSRLQSQRPRLEAMRCALEKAIETDDGG